MDERDVLATQFDAYRTRLQAVAYRMLGSTNEAAYSHLLRLLAQMCYVKEGRRPSPGTIQRVLADGPPPTRSGRRYPAGRTRAAHRGSARQALWTPLYRIVPCPRRATRCAAPIRCH